MSSASQGIYRSPAGASGASANATEPLDLAALLSEAAANNLELKAAVARVHAAEHFPSQAEALPDPEASVAYTNVSFTRVTLGSDSDSDLTFRWSQALSYPGKRGLAGDVARAEIGVLSQMLELRRLRVRASVKQAYADLFRIDRTALILRESRTLLESFLQAARARYESGEGILENVLKAQTELTRIDVRIAGVGQERRSTEVALNALTGTSEDRPLGAALALPQTVKIDIESFEQAAVERSPEMMGLAGAAGRESKRVELAKRNLKPDFAWAASYANRGGIDPMITGEFGVRLPLYRRRKQAEAVAQAEFEFEAARRDMAAREVQIRAEVREMVAHVEHQDHLIELYGEGILPQARSALDSAAASYGSGKAEFLTLITDFLVLLDSQIEYEAQRAEKVKALASLEPLTGGDLVLPDGEGAAASAQEVTHE